jgi:hypothetical protein
MADDTLLVPARASRRRRLVARRRRRRRFFMVFAVALVAGGSAGSFALTRDHDATKRAAGPTGSSTFAGKAGALPQVNDLRSDAPPRIVSHDAPLKLWVGGDSLAGGFGPALGRIAGATGVVHTQVDYKVSSGLADNGVRDWTERATEQMQQYDPEVAVFEVGTNDASIVNSHLNADGVPEWEPQYRMQVARMMETLRGDEGHRRTVLWVGAPPMSVSWRDEGVRELNRVMQEEAKKRAPDVVYVDAYSLFADENGDYTSEIPTLSGEIERVRISDGVHFTEAGAEYLGAVVFSLIDARWQIERHADKAQPINWEESSGSSGNGGGSSGSSGSSGSGRSGSSDNGSSDNGSSGSGGSSGTTPGTPAPPPSLETTAPPTVPASTTPATVTGTSVAPPASSTPPAT